MVIGIKEVNGDFKVQDIEVNRDVLKELVGGEYSELEILPNVVLVTKEMEYYEGDEDESEPILEGLELNFIIKKIIAEIRVYGVAVFVGVGDLGYDSLPDDEIEYLDWMCKSNG